jgi:hypothetical protein
MWSVEDTRLAFEGAARMRRYATVSAAEAQGDAMIGEVVRAGWTRSWETVHQPLGAGADVDADETASFFACGMLGDTLTAIRLPVSAGKRGSFSGRAKRQRTPAAPSRVVTVGATSPVSLSA